LFGGYFGFGFGFGFGRDPDLISASEDFFSLFTIATEVPVAKFELNAGMNTAATAINTEESPIANPVRTLRFSLLTL